MMCRALRRFSLFALVASLVVPAAGAASTASTNVFLPSVGSAPGVPPSVWYTTIWVFNPNDVPANVDLSFLPRDQVNDPTEMVHPMTVGAGAVVQIDDAVSTLFGVQGFGAIRALADVPIHVVARIYSQATDQQERDSAGQAFHGVPAERSIGSGEEADLIGLTNLDGGDFRFNVGFVETTGGDLWVQVQLLSSSGGSWVSSSIRLLPFEQKQMSVDQLFNNAIGDSDNFRLHVTGANGSGRVIVFGSRIANGSQDATTFEMTAPAMP